MALTKQELIENFKANDKLSIEFIKKDGTNRKMLCTRSLIPEDKMPKQASVDETDYVHVFDLEANGWRSIYPDTITTWSVAS
jgi:hypothetical protein